MPKRPRQRCYYCGRPAATREHAPPRLMFAAFECDSITVPSCREHNNDKSGSDHAIVNALLIPLETGLETGKERYPQKEEVRLAINTAKPSFELTRHRAIRAPLIKNPPAELRNMPHQAFLHPEVNLELWAKQLTAALFHNAFGWDSYSINWHTAEAWSPF